MESDESQYHAVPQTMGRIAHKTVDVLYLQPIITQYFISNKSEIRS